MALDKLNIEEKVDNETKRKLLDSGLVAEDETLSAKEVNAMSSKINELVDAYNFGTPITGFNFKENVATYADLPTEGNEVNDGYGVLADGLVYVWNGSAFPSDGDGIDLGLKAKGKVEEGDMRAVSGEEVDLKTLTKSEFLEKARESVNLFDKEAVSFGKSIGLSGNIYSTSNQDLVISDYIKVKKGVKIGISGWFVSNNDYRRCGVYENIGDTIALESKVVTDNYFTPNYEGFLVVRVVVSSSPAYDKRETLQIQEGGITDYEPYSPNFEEKIKTKYLPKQNIVDLKKVVSFNRLDSDLLHISKTVNEFGDVIDGDPKDYTYGPIQSEQSNFIYVRNMPPNHKHTVTVIGVDDKVIYRGVNSFVGKEGTIRNRQGSYKMYLSGKFNTKEELKICSLSFFRSSDTFLKLNADSNVTTRTLPKPIHPKLTKITKSIGKNKDLTYRQFTIKSDVDTEQEVIVPIHLNWGVAPDYASERERFVFMQEKCFKDFSDISIVNSETNEILPIDVQAGNYSLIPVTNGYMAMFQDHQDKNIIVGANRGGGGLFKSVDFGKTFESLNIDGQLCFMSKKGDLFYMVKTSDKAEIWKTTKSSDYSDGHLVLTLEYQSSVINPSQFTEDNEANIFMGTYQNEFDTRVYKSTDGGENWFLKFSTIKHQHVHLLHFEKTDDTLWLSCDGSVDSMQNNGVDPDVGMALYKSTDGGENWEMVALPFTTDKGFGAKIGDYCFGAGEANIKATPSLFRTKDYKNIEILDEVPCMNSILKKFDSNLIKICQPYRDFGYSQVLLSTDFGKSFAPIYQSAFINTNNLTLAYRYGSDDFENMTDEQGKEFKWMCSGSGEYKPFRLYIGRDTDYQSIVYMKTRLKKGDNVFKVVSKTNDNPSFEVNGADSEVFKVEFKDNNAELSSGISVPYNQDTLQAQGVYNSFRFPYSHSGSAINLPKGLAVPINVYNIKTIRFGYKSVTNSSNGVNKRVSILKGSNLEIFRNNQDLLLVLNGLEYVFTYVFRSQFTYTPTDLVLTFENGSVKLYGNGYLHNTLSCNVPSIGFDYLNVQDRNSENIIENTDLISNIKLYDKNFTQHEVVELFEGVKFF